MGKKYDYAPGMCHLQHYNGYYPVLREGTPGNYKKVGMVCRLMTEECAKDCDVFQNAPDIAPANEEWKLRDTKYDE